MNAMRLSLFFLLAVSLSAQQQQRVAVLPPAVPLMAGVKAGDQVPPVYICVSGCTYSDSAGIANIRVTTDATPIPANTCTNGHGGAKDSYSVATMPGVGEKSTFIFTPTVNLQAVPGWGASAGLTIGFWPTPDTLNWYVCNVTTAAITPKPIMWNVSAK